MTLRWLALAVLLVAQYGGGAPVVASVWRDANDADHTPQRRLRGAVMVMDICLSCHDVAYLKYRHLVDLGLSEEQLLQKHLHQDLNQPLLSAMSTADREAMFGRVPPDLSLIVNARAGGARYIHALFTGYHATPTGETVNTVRPGIRMPDIFGYSTAVDPEARAAIEDRIRDVAAFLHWVSNPHEDRRKSLGYWVLGYLLLLTLLLYRVKRRVWRRLARPS